MKGLIAGRRAAESVPLAKSAAEPDEATAAKPETRATGTVPTAREPEMSTFHRDAPAAFWKSAKLPVGDVSVLRFSVKSVMLLAPPVAAYCPPEVGALWPSPSELCCTESAVPRPVM